MKTRNFAKFNRRGLLAMLAMAMPVAAVPFAVVTASTPTVAETALAPLDLTQYRGKVVYLDFWASWCAPCKLSFRYMNQLRATYPAKDLVILTVNVDRNKAAAAGFLSTVGGGLPVIYDPQGAIASHYRVNTMPTTVLIGRDGQEHFVHRGYFDTKTDEYTQHVAALVANRP